jgi:di/tricarboxylate transporter
MVGLQEWLVWASWVIYTMMVYTFTSIALTVCLKISVNGAVLLNYSNPIIIWVMLILFSLSCTFMYLFISSLFNTRKFY